jgi:hypothetical protein
MIETGRALPVEFGCLSINNDEPIISRRTDDGTAIIMEITLSAGHKTLRAWFKDLNRRDLCGAYYIKIQSLS